MVSFYSLFICICLNFLFAIEWDFVCECVCVCVLSECILYCEAATQSNWQKGKIETFENVAIRWNSTHNSNLFNGEPYWKLFFMCSEYGYRKSIHFLLLYSILVNCEHGRFLLFISSRSVFCILASSGNRLNSLCKSKYWFFIIFVLCSVVVWCGVVWFGAFGWNTSKKTIFEAKP